MSTTVFTPVLSGWRCPGCGACYAPSVACCWTCIPAKPAERANQARPAQPDAAKPLPREPLLDRCTP